jgi:8-amino-7-oxononanoate synthase
MSYLERVNAAIARIRAADRYRSVTLNGPLAIDFSTNDYLGLSADPRVVEALHGAGRAGSSGSRLLGGNHPEHVALEEELATWLGRERALLFSSGYMAAAGAVSVLASVMRIAYSDQLNHASLIDALLASKIDRSIYAHGTLPPKDKRTGPALIVSESIFSMDGDAADVDALVRDLGDDDVLLLDEAHALGVAGVRGAGLAATIDDPRIVILGTLSKSLGSQGGFVAGPAALVELLTNAARSFIFDTALAPALAQAARTSLGIAAGGDALRATLHANVARLQSGLRECGYATPGHRSAIVPVVQGSERAALDVSARLRAANITAPAIRPPTVPAGTSRLRFSVRANHTPAEIDAVLEALTCIAIS